jgi:hypothetical protein
MENTKLDETGQRPTSRKAAWRKKYPKKEMVSHARWRARQLGVPFNLKPSDFEIPDKCPLLGIPLKVNAGAVGIDSPTLDRKVPHLGYVVGNVWVISHRANAMKGTASVETMMNLFSELNDNTSD